MPVKVYIAGKVTGLPYALALSHFGNAELKLKQCGYDVYNPLSHVPPTATWKEAMAICIPALLQCDKLLMLPNWQESKGARLEVHAAVTAGIELIESV